MGCLRLQYETKLTLHIGVKTEVGNLQNLSRLPQKSRVETGLYYYGARYYNPKISNWLSVDPIALYDPIQETEHYLDGEHNGGYFNPRNMSVYGYCYQSPVMFVDPNGKQSLWNRVFGAAQTAGGALEVVGGVGLILTPEPTMATKVGGAALIANGADNFQAGIRQLITGESVDTMLHTGVESGAEALGADADTANKLATAADISTILLGGGAGVLNISNKLLSKGFGSIKNLNNFINSAGAISKNGLTNAGRALQKHAGRAGSSFSDIKFSGKTANKDGMKVINDILGSKDQMIQKLENGTKNIFDKATGRGVNVSREGKFNGFRDIKDIK
jgi:RHS repeat-associated protein